MAKKERKRSRTRRISPTPALKSLFRLFILPFAVAYKFINNDALTYTESIQRFWDTARVGVYFCKAEQDFFVPGRAWTDSPYHKPPLANANRRVKESNAVTVRVEYENGIVDLEFNEVVFRMNMEQFDLIKGKLEFVC